MGAHSNTVAHVKGALSAIDAVHSVSSSVMPRVQVTCKPMSGSKRGVIYCAKNPPQITVSTVGGAPRMTMAHEIGHGIDYHMFGRPGAFAFGSERPGVHTEMDALMHELRSTTTIRDVAAVAHGAVPSANADARRHAQYMMDGREIFARAYAQWITNRSGDPVMHQELHRAQAHDRTYAAMNGHNKNYQWPDHEFAPVMARFDDLFRSHGLRTQMGQPVL